MNVDPNAAIAATLQHASQLDAPLTPRVAIEPALATLLAKNDAKVLLPVVVRFVGTRVRPGPVATLAERREEAAQANAAQIANAIAAARTATGETPRRVNVFALMSSVYLEGTASFVNALLAQPRVVGAALNSSDSASAPA